MRKTFTNEKVLLNLKEFMEYTGFKETYARQLLKRPRIGFSLKLGGKWYVHRERFDEWLVEKCGEY